MASPSQGKLKNHLTARELALQYDQAGVNAISILTEKHFFHGSLFFLKRMSERLTCPILRKDFILDEYQILESRYFGADAILLIAQLLSLAKLKSFLATAARYNMAVICEVHDPKDLEKVLASGAEIIGINNRNLKTLEVDRKTTERLLPVIPPEKIIIAASGLRMPEDLRPLRGKIDAILVGQALVEAPNIKAKIQSFLT